MSDAIICELELKKFSATMTQLKELVAGLNDVNKALGSTGGAGGSSPKSPKIPKPPLTWQEKSMKALMSSRFGTSGGIMPLIGKTAEIFGKFGPVVLSATAAVATLASITKDAAELMKKAADNFYDTGGSPGELSTADNISRMSGDDINKLAIEHQQSIISGGMSTAYANQHGISDQPGMPKLDAMTDYLKHLSDLADPNKTSQAQAQREIKANPSLRPAMGMRDLTEETRRHILSDVHDEMFSPENRRLAKEYESAIADISREWDMFKENLGGPIMKAIVWLGSVTDHFKDLGKAIEWVLSPITMLIRDLKYMAGYAGALFGGANEKDAEKIAEESSQNRAIDSTDRNTAAIEEHTQIMREGTYGGGARTRGAIPGAYHGVNGQNTERFLQNNMNAMGAFGMGT